MTIRNILDIFSAVAVLAFIACCVVAAVRQTKGYRKLWDFLDWQLNKPVHLFYVYGLPICGDADKRDPVTREPHAGRCCMVRPGRPVKGD